MIKNVKISMVYFNMHLRNTYDRAFLRLRNTFCRGKQKRTGAENAAQAHDGSEFYMKLYIRQKVFSWGDKFRIYDEYENDRYYVEGEVFTFGKKLHLYGQAGNELAFIHQKVWSFLPKYFISRNGVDVAQVIKKFTFFRHEYAVEGLGWTVNGDFLAHEYEISAAGRTVASISKHWFTWSDTYEIDVADAADETMALCVVLIIDAVIAQSRSSAAASGN